MLEFLFFLFFFYLEAPLIYHATQLPFLGWMRDNGTFCLFPISAVRVTEKKISRFLVWLFSFIFFREKERILSFHWTLCYFPITSFPGTAHAYRFDFLAFFPFPLFFICPRFLVLGFWFRYRVFASFLLFFGLGYLCRTGLGWMGWNGMRWDGMEWIPTTGMLLHL